MSMTADRRWRRTITLKDLLGPESDGATVRRCAKAMSDRLKRQSDYEPEGLDEFSQIVDEMAGIAYSTPDDYTHGGLDPCEALQPGPRRVLRLG